MTNHDNPTTISTRPELENRPDPQAANARTPYPTRGDEMILVPELTIPASMFDVIAEGKRRLDAIAAEVADLAEFIGRGAGQHALTLSFSKIDSEQLEVILGQLGWNELHDTLEDLGESLLSAAGDTADISPPKWSKDLGAEWDEAAVAFDPDGERAEQVRRRIAVKQQFDRIMAGQVE